MTGVLTLKSALSSGRLYEFITQEEARGRGPVDRAEFDGAVDKVIKERQSEDRTSRFESGGNSSGKRIRRDTGQDGSD